MWTGWYRGIIGLLWACLPLLAAAQQLQLQQTPSWVRPVADNPAFVVDTALVDEGYTYRLRDYQVHVPSQTLYCHYVREVLNPTGVEASGKLLVVYDPAFQKLRWHQVQILRQGKVVAQAGQALVREAAVESEAEANLYNGTLQQTVLLYQLQPGDRVEYAFSITGFNPVMRGHYTSDFVLTAYEPIGRVNLDVLAAPSSLHFKEWGGEFGQTIRRSERPEGQLLRYTWQGDAQKGHSYEPSTPAGFYPYGYVSISTVADWPGFVQLIQPHYRLASLDKAVAAKAKELLAGAATTEAGLLRMVRYVQDDIRYTGLENGISAYRPHPPTEVMARGFGDCKDKSLLLVALLRSAGIEATPMLVHTDLRGRLANEVPGNQFNHCIVRAKVGGTWRSIDPTINLQGGIWRDFYCPPYGYGLVLEGADAGLQPLEASSPGDREVTEHFVVDGTTVEDGARLQLTWRLRGAEADRERSYLARSSRKDVEQRFLEYVTENHEGAQLQGTYAVQDNRDSNQMTLELRFRLPKLWKDNGYHKLEARFMAQELWSYLDHVPEPARQLPFATYQPIRIRHEQVIELPEKWGNDDEAMQPVQVKSPYLYYHSISNQENQADGTTFRLVRTLHYLEPVVPATAVPAFAADLQTINEDTGFRLYTKPGGDSELQRGAQPYALAVVLVLLVVLVFVAARTAFRR